MEKRKIALTKLIGIEDKTYIEVEKFKCIYAISHEDLERKTDVKASTYIFVALGLMKLPERPLSMAQLLS